MLLDQATASPKLELEGAQIGHEKWRNSMKLR